jgi:hypothetical protein
MYSYTIIETKKHGLILYAYGIFYGKALISHETFVCRELAETAARRIVNSLNEAVA